MDTTEKLNAILAAYREALADPDAFDIVEDIEKRLEEGGIQWVIEGKKLLLEFHTETLKESMAGPLPIIGNGTVKSQQIESIEDTILTLVNTIDLLSGQSRMPALNHPAVKELKQLTHGNNTIADANLGTTLNAAIVGAEIRKHKEFAIYLNAHDEQAIILTADDLRRMLAVIEQHKVYDFFSA